MDAHHDHADDLPPSPDNPATGKIAAVLMVIGVLTLAATIGVVQLFHKEVRELKAERALAPHPALVATQGAAAAELSSTTDGRITIDAAIDKVSKDAGLLAPIKAPAK